MMTSITNTYVRIDIQNLQIVKKNYLITHVIFNVYCSPVLFSVGDFECYHTVCKDAEYYVLIIMNPDV